jgi:hypothetical protein
VTPTTLYAGSWDGGVFKSTNSGGNWVNIGLINARLITLAIDPVTPTTLYARTSGNDIFKSTDGGESWHAVNAGLTDTIGGKHWSGVNIDLNSSVSALAIDPTTPTTLYGGAWGGVFKSIDDGKSWVNIGLTGIEILDLVVIPLTPSTIYVATQGGGIFVSQQAN